MDYFDIRSPNVAIYVYRLHTPKIDQSYIVPSFLCKSVVHRIKYRVVIPHSSLLAELAKSRAQPRPVHNSTTPQRVSTRLIKAQMPTTTYSPPERPFLDPPHTSSLPSADSLGLNGANAWAYSISTRLMTDNGRWDLFNLVQGGMLWLDEYMLEIEQRLQNGKHEEEM